MACVRACVRAMVSSRGVRVCVHAPSIINMCPVSVPTVAVL